MGKPKWITPERQAELVKLFLESQGFCIYGHSPCFGTLKRKETAVCQWGKFCIEPLKDGEPCRYKPEEGKPRLPCHIQHAVKLTWLCGHGDKRCHCAFNLADDTLSIYGLKGENYYPIYSRRLVRDWQADDRSRRLAEAKAEAKQLHALAERREPLRGRFSAISREIILANQPEYYLEGLGISGLTFKPFAKIRLASSYMRLYVDLKDSLKPLSKNQKRKAVRYGKALPNNVEDIIADKCHMAVRHFYKQ